MTISSNFRRKRPMKGGMLTCRPTTTTMCSTLCGAALRSVCRTERASFPPLARETIPSWAAEMEAIPSPEAEPIPSWAAEMEAIPSPEAEPIPSSVAEMEAIPSPEAEPIPSWAAEMEAIPSPEAEPIPSWAAEMEAIPSPEAETIPSSMAVFECLEALARLTDRAARVLDSRMQADLGIGFAQIRVLRWIRDAGGPTSETLARRGEYSRRNVDVKISWLIDAGLVERVGNPGGRRVTYRPTELGVAVCAQADVLIVDQTDSTLRALSEEKRISLSHLVAWPIPSGRPGIRASARADGDTCGPSSPRAPPG